MDNSDPPPNPDQRPTIDNSDPPPNPDQHPAINNSDPRPNPVELGPPLGYSQLTQVPFNPFKCGNSQVPDPINFVIKPTSVAAPTQFPPIKDAPANLRPRHSDQELELGFLDASYQQTQNNDLRDMAVLDANHLQEDRRAPARLARRAAYEAVQQHINRRRVYVHLSADRLQAATGMRNSYAFFPPNPVLPIPTATFGPSTTTPRATPQNRPNEDLRNRLILNAPMAMNVDPHTGEGLRDWLLTMGKIYGMSKRECTHISFHDLTAHPKSGDWANVKIGHYGLGGRGERITVYESNIPITEIDDNCMAYPKLQAWTWFLISRPILSIDARDVSTQPQRTWVPTSSSPTSSESRSATEGYFVEPEPMFSTHMGPPPNFPRPIPTSFIVFACPTSNITQYDEITETMRPESVVTPFSRNDFPHVPGTRGSMVYKRKDFDLSHQGVPFFEYGGSKFFNQHTHFLSVEKIGPWYDNDPFLPIDPEANELLTTNWLESTAANVHADRRSLAAQGRIRFFRNYLNEPPAPLQGRWWERFHRGVYDDAERWRAIRRAMALGKCRVVVRYKEYQVAAPVHQGLNQGAQTSGAGGSGGSFGATKVDRKGKGKAMPESSTTHRRQGQVEQRQPSKLSTTFNDTSIDTNGEESGSYMDTLVEFFDEDLYDAN